MWDQLRSLYVTVYPSVLVCKIHIYTDCIVCDCRWSKKNIPDDVINIVWALGWALTWESFQEIRCLEAVWVVLHHYDLDDWGAAIKWIQSWTVTSTHSISQSTMSHDASPRLNMSPLSKNHHVKNTSARKTFDTFRHPSHLQTSNHTFSRPSGGHVPWQPGPQPSLQPLTHGGHIHLNTIPILGEIWVAQNEQNIYIYILWY